MAVVPRLPIFPDGWAGMLKTFMVRDIRMCLILLNHDSNLTLALMFCVVNPSLPEFMTGLI
jgi:hypothetical protein